MTRLCVFLGASYFRAVARAKSTACQREDWAINTGEAKGEEFPLFKTFWIEKPATNATSLVVHALLDSQSTTAAYRFTNGQATPRYSTWKWPSIPASISIMPASRR